MDQAAERVPAQHLDICTQSRWIRMPSRRGLLQCPVRPVDLVMVGVLVQDQSQVPFAGDQHLVQAGGPRTVEPSGAVGHNAEVLINDSADYACIASAIGAAMAATQAQPATRLPRWAGYRAIIWRWALRNLANHAEEDTPVIGNRKLRVRPGTPGSELQVLIQQLDAQPNPHLTRRQKRNCPGLS